jgi:restriction endonuclease S subunit
MKVRLADIAEVRTGFPFRKAVQPVPGGTLAVVQMKDIDDSAGLNLEGLTLIEDDAKRYEQHLLNFGDVLLQSRGSKFPAAVVDKPVHGIAALGLIVIRPHAIVPEYLKWVLNQSRTRDAFRGAARGTYIPFLSRTNVEDAAIPVPAVEIQQRIVEIDRLLSREQRLARHLIELKTQFTDALLWRAATSNSRS